MRKEDTTGEKGKARQPGRVLALAHGLTFTGAAATAALTASSARWTLATLVILCVFTCVGMVTAVRTSSKLQVSGTMLGFMLAMVMLGGAPAALIGVITMLLGGLRFRTPLLFVRNNVVTFAWLLLIGGLFFHGTTQLLHAGPNSALYYLLVFATFVLSLFVNFLGVFSFNCYLDGSSLRQRAREAVMPVMSAQLFSALLTMGAVYVTVQAGTVGLALVALTLAIFQYLVGELLTSKQRGEDLHRMATTDELTGLANRERFRDRLTERIAEASSEGSGFGVILLDLDRFKEINDTLGHHYGDALLRELGPRLARCAGAGGLVARLGGDEFAVLPEEQTGEIEMLEAIAARMLTCVQEPVALDEMTVDVGASIGIARFPENGDDPHTLLRRADVAMYAAKEAHAGCRVYEAELDRNSVQRLNLISDFRRALEADEIVVYYQPVVDVGGTEVQGAEGLIRWQHPERGLLPPGAFVETIEQTELIGPLTRYVLERCIAQCAQWRQSGRGFSVGVNLSVRNLLDRDLPADIEALLAKYDLPPDALQLEITESMLMSDPERALATVTRLSALGARISVDDFGTGYSSLANLRRFPIDELKIDRSFVSPMLQDESDLIIVRSTINLGHDLGLRVIAEGVEDEETLRWLARLGCDLAQGYHMSRPLPADLFADWIAEAESRSLRETIAA
jgi:diguanylate cyclase (GGDEF)-like protein